MEAKLDFNILFGTQTMMIDNAVQSRAEKFPNQLVTLDEVLEAGAASSRTRLYELMKNGLFPKPIKPSPKVLRWTKTEVVAMVAALINGCTPNELRELTERLTMLRKVSAVRS